MHPLPGFEPCPLCGTTVKAQATNAHGAPIPTGIHIACPTCGLQLPLNCCGVEEARKIWNTRWQDKPLKP
ncbi:hypothetical protein [Magnetococcus sp. PR-3]|uniref:hypothetical protein n=1 Tax=Magnetococcus sp. PR-3 TaxID=3120355 RepID=UPI002FCE52F8